MAKVEFTEVGYPADNELILNHMREMVAEGEKHPNIVAANKSLRALEELLLRKNNTTSSQV